MLIFPGTHVMYKDLVDDVPTFRPTGKTWFEWRMAANVGLETTLVPEAYAASVHLIRAPEEVDGERTAPEGYVRVRPMEWVR